MEEESIAVPGEETPAPSASETESAFEAEISEAATSEQPAEEATAKGTRAQERIRKLSSEANYWRDIAQSKEEPKDDTGEVTVQEIAKQTAATVRAEMRQEEARKQMFQDAQVAEEKYPELETDQELAADVLALAQGRGISIIAAAERIIGQRSKDDTAKKEATNALKASTATPTGKKVSSGEPAKPDISSMSEAEKAANWNEILANYS